MYAACARKVVGRKRAHKGIEGVRGNVNIAVFNTYNYGRVVEVVRGSTKLDNVADFKRRKRDFFRKRTYAVLVAYKEVVKVFNARPGRRSVVYRAVIPAESRCKIHCFCARIDALRSKIRAVAAYILKIVKGGVARKCPTLCVLVCGGAVVFENSHTSLYAISAAQVEYMDVEKILSLMTAEEKAAVVAGTDFMYTNPVPRLNIPQLCFADGPHGLRKQVGVSDNGIAPSEPSTAFPTAAMLASGWNSDNAYKVGEAIAKECVHYGVDVLLGPGLNIKRNPLCGRNFEYFSEDAYLASQMAIGEVQGIQFRGVGACIKHFALNNTENYRFTGDSIADERTQREIYFRAFERVIKLAKPYAVMSAYNKINGVPCCENAKLLKEILRGEWGFDGVVMTDWGAMTERVAALKAGLDLEMPGDTKYCRNAILKALKSGALEAGELDDCVRNILRLSVKCGRKQREEVDFEAHHLLSAEIAQDCAVLMKNNGALPLERGEKVLVCGELFENMRYQGAGSSMINATRITTPLQAFTDGGANFEYVRGYAANSDVSDPQLVAEAVLASLKYDKVLLFAGLTDEAESEGVDRTHMRLPQNQLDLIDALIGAGAKIVLVLFGGSVVELPFAESLAAILNMFLPGQNGGTAVFNLLYGRANPCGRLAETYPESYADVPFGGTYSAGNYEIYRESVFVSYRYYLTAGKKVAFPFGFGLSYTQFEYSNLSCAVSNGKCRVSCTVKNIGKYDGAEVVQLYTGAPQGVFKPERELRAFTKIYLKAGESGRAELEFDIDDLRYWNVKLNRFVLEGGKYSLYVCSDCLTVKLQSEIDLDGEEVVNPYSISVNAAYCGGNLSKVSDEIFAELCGFELPPQKPKLPLTMESRFEDLKLTFLGRMIYAAVMSIPKKQLKKALKMPLGAERDNAVKGAEFLRRVLESGCLRSMSMSSPRLPYNVARGIAKIVNGHIFGGLLCICSPIRVPKLPKNSKKKQ